uniref:Uncharacterized protein n=1 Tax=Globisporangium ultimum (strain ATCC 200006 / CBS 805.95 / DAOM BR144) TaxID=431595 RepID=K3X9F1_GLOUD
MFETEVMSRRVANRIRHVYQQLQDVDKTEKSSALDQYSGVIARFHQFLLKHGGQDFTTRLVLGYTALP